MLPWIVGIGALLLIGIIWFLLFRAVMKDPNINGGGIDLG
jgi:hypothetical protein